MRLMLGANEQQMGCFRSYVSLEKQVPDDHSVRVWGRLMEVIGNLQRTQRAADGAVAQQLAVSRWFVRGLEHQRCGTGSAARATR